MFKDIFDYIKSEEENYKQPIDMDGWDWSMVEHLKTSFYYKHGRLLTGNSDDKPVKNITRPILNLQYRTEDIDVKNIILYINDPKLYHLSFLIKKYHDEIFIKENDLDTYLDELNKSRIDYGGGLTQDIGTARPRNVNLRSIVFCDQTNILSGPIGLKHYYSPSELKEMEAFGWGSTKNGATASIEDVIVLSEDMKDQTNDGVKTKTPGKYIEVYEVYGTFPDSYLDDNGDMDKYSKQMHIVCFYINDKNESQGVTLYRGKNDKENFKIILRDSIFGRALGFGGAEELFEPQVWVNYDVIRMKEMLDSAAKTIYKTTDKTFANRNKINDMDNMEIAVLEEGTDITQIDTFPRNIAIFEKAVEQWELHAQQTGAANDSIMGKSPTSGTPFALQELVTNESRGLHDFRQGQFAKFIEEVYRDWIIPHIIKQITNGKKFLAKLDLEEMQFIADTMAKNKANSILTEKVLNGESIEEGEKEMLEEEAREDFMKDNKKFIELLKDEFKDTDIKMNINISGKQKNLQQHVVTLTNIFRQVASAPQILADPNMANLFNQILEASGLDPVDFAGFSKVEQPQPQLNNQIKEQL